MEVDGLVLAAGAGRRYGMPKALVAYHGELLVQRAARTLREAGCARTVVVLGAQAARVRTAAPGLCGPGPVCTVENPDWPSGMGSSLRAGLAALDGTPAVAAVVLLVDMPGVTAAAVRRVIGYAAAEALVVGGYGDRRGHPVLLGRDHWAAVATTATGDRGARDHLRAHADRVRVVAVGDVADDTDLDEPPVGRNSEDAGA
jgi:nicotine blue oxidoreductase